MSGVFPKLQSQAYTSLDELSPFQWQLAALIAGYTTAIGLCIWGIAAISAQDPDAIAVTAPGWIWALLTTIVHMTILSVSYWLDNDPYPMDPKWGFVTVDFLVAICFGLAIGGLAANSIALLMITNALLVIACGFVLYKYLRIAYDIQQGHRDRNTGVLKATASTKR